MRESGVGNCVTNCLCPNVPSPIQSNKYQKISLWKMSERELRRILLNISAILIFRDNQRRIYYFKRL